MSKRILLDAFFYLAVPLLMWNMFRESLGDYYTILYGMLPAVIYTIAMAVIKKEWNVTGIFFLSLISLNFVFNLISKTAEQELWNGVYMSIISIAFYLLTILIKKPIGMYFFIDYAYAKGVPRKASKALYRTTENYGHFVKFTLFLVLREVVVGGVKSFLIFNKGVEAFNTIQVTSSVLGYVFTGLTVLYVIYIIKRTKK
jgi:hypothetical protein